ncbi:hypothetical protein BpHYR1_024923 [Brachionus plicatilis]|uniref:Uncharacterized protein n=1 Tax=Brachionus plicatilis TaxID=10195 RepID=A0A3M7PDI7_BRAPC|nr:hypothetical protein BpHYR1_024923 [Brachionus plicatilis]
MSILYAVLFFLVFDSKKLVLSKILIQKYFFRSRILTFQYTLIVRLYSSSRLLRSSQLFRTNLRIYLNNK